MKLFQGNKCKKSTTITVITKDFLRHTMISMVWFQQVSAVMAFIQYLIINTINRFALNKTSPGFTLLGPALFGRLLILRFPKVSASPGLIVSMHNCFFNFLVLHIKNKNEANNRCFTIPKSKIQVRSLNASKNCSILSISLSLRPKKTNLSIASFGSFLKHIHRSLSQF